MVRHDYYTVNIMTPGQMRYARLLPLLNEVLGRIMVPVVQLNKYGSSFDDILNLGSTSCNQIIWSIVGRCDV